MECEYQIPGGRLRIGTVQELLPLDDLMGFAARANPRRPFLFVSKVLGRHVPCRPALMRKTYRLLAETLIALHGPVWMIGMAETAIGLGAGIADTLARESGRDDLYSQHTTRMRIGPEPLLTFREAHSHAPSHLLYEPYPHLRSAFEGARSLVVVDDEISTGRSVRELVARALACMPSVEHVAVVALADWLDDQQRDDIARTVSVTGKRSPSVSWHSLLSGRFAFVPDADFLPGTLPTDVEPCRSPPPARADLGRRALAVPYGGFPSPPIPHEALPPPCPIAMIGTGECAFEPFMLAEALESEGYTPTVQCVSRSPILTGGAIRSTAVWPDPYDEDVGYYLHNPPDRKATVVALCERDGYRPKHSPEGHVICHVIPPNLYPTKELK